MKFQKINNLKVNGHFIRKIGYKSYPLHILGLLIIVALILPMNKLCYILAVIVLTINMTIFIFADKRTVADIYDNGILLYNPTDSSQGCFIPYESIKSFNIKKINQMHFQLTNDEEMDVETYQIFKLNTSLNNAMRTTKK